MRDVMKENAARELFCPLRAAYCRGDACMAWAVSWENNNEGYCSAFRATYEQEIGEGWKKYGRRIMDTQKKLRARLEQAEAERDRARRERDTLEQNQGCWTGRTCVACSGTGERDEMRNCPKCGGTGETWETYEEQLARLREIERLAKECRAKAMEFRTGDRLGWPESEAAVAASKVHDASEALFTALGKEDE